MEGTTPILIVADTDPRGEGHYTRYPTDKPTATFEIPFANGKLPEHEVIGRGPCQGMMEVVNGDGKDEEMKFQDGQGWFQSVLGGWK